MSIQEESGAEVGSVEDRVVLRLRSVPWQWWAFVALTAFNLYGVVIHSMWRDEMQQWNIVRASASLSDLVRNLRFEGHPWLWYLLIWPLSKVSRDPLSLKLLHFAIAFSSSLVVMLKAPFRRSIRLLIVAGYFFSFEYMVITRSYALGVLLVVCWCAWGARTEERPIRSALLLGLLANTSVYGAMLACVLALGEVIGLFRQRAVGAGGTRTDVAPFLRFATVFALLLVISFATMSFANGGGVRWRYVTGFGQDFAGWVMSLHSVATTILPLPVLGREFWSSSLFFWLDAPLLTASVSAGVLAFVFTILRRGRMASLLFGLLFIGVFLFSHFVYLGHPRHTGILFVGFIALLWRWHPAPAGDATDGLELTGRFLMTILLLAHVVATAIAGTAHLLYPFSMGEATAKVIREGGFYRYPIVANPDYAVISAVGYLDRPVHFASTRRPGMFVSWSYSDRKWVVSGEEAVAYARYLSTRMGIPVLLLTNEPVAGPGLVLLFAVDGSIVADEQFFVYMLTAPTVVPMDSR